ncbi:Transcription factor BIM2 [Quillaja saponaria]|uniref:Transcription factor BIM2 n=1 Tax=Quillaja saponaria TaxID=32244 RepID=A0AAD7PXS3_QUISA|nr:Transcription factor BIM2 [Quillaja saponaria]
MARSKKGRQEELDDDYDEPLMENGSSSHRVKGDEANREQKVNTHRSKHSETEQRRRSKINERFQILRDLIPQNDQKRDKASFLLEVIEYIQFLQEKLNMYEGSYQGWNQEPTKLIPWRNHRGPAENIMDDSLAIQNGSNNENNVSPALFANAQKTFESEVFAASIQNALAPDSGTQAVPLNIQMQSNMHDSVVRGGIPTQHLQESVSIAENISSLPQPQLWLDRADVSVCDVPDNTLNEQEELGIESGLISISSVYSQGVLDTLTQVLQSSGVDLSEASVSVQLDVGRRANKGSAATASGSKGYENQSSNDRLLACPGVRNCSEDSEQALKRLRTEAS